MKQDHEGPILIAMCVDSKGNHCKHVVQHPFMPIFRCGHPSVKVEESRVGGRYEENGVVTPKWCPVLKTPCQH